jgi:hypothetical protein
MLMQLNEILPRFDLSFEVVCVDDDGTYRERWGEQIPVLLRDGVAVAKLRTDPQSLERIVRRRR